MPDLVVCDVSVVFFFAPFIFDDVSSHLCAWSLLVSVAL